MAKKEAPPLVGCLAIFCAVLGAPMLLAGLTMGMANRMWFVYVVVGAALLAPVMWASSHYSIRRP